MKRNKRKLKGFSLLLTFVMIFGLICSNLSAYAESGEEHVHTEECYAQAGDLLCTAEESDGHTHGENCYCKGGEYTCGQEESEGHTHTDACYEILEEGAEKNLICGQEESKGHIHSENCICPGGEIICGKNEEEGHTHTDDCYAKGGELICTADKDDEVRSAEENNEDIVKASTFSDMTDAIQSLKDSESEKSGIIQITEDIVFTDQITIPAGVNVTIIGDETNHKIYKSDDAKNSTLLFVIEDGAEFTIDGDLTFLGKKSGPGLIKCCGKFTLKNGTLDFDGFGIPACGGIVSVWGENADFTMKNGTIRNAYINACSAGVRICGGGSFTMDGGTICDMTAGGNLEAGAVLVFACDSNSIGKGDASFTMNDGIIENNTGYRGAGVFVIGREYTYRATMEMNGGKIRNNKCQGDDDDQGAGAGVYVQQNAVFTMNDGEISGNEVDMGQGGGVCVACGWESVAGTPGWNIDLFSRYYPAAFTMNGGTISNNRAKINKVYGDNGCGGGIYIASNCVSLNGGTIENNKAEKQGGGVYVGATPYILKIHNAVVKENHATVLGGGLWACPTGDVELFVTNGAALYDNSSDGAGDDLVSVKIPSKNHVLTLADRALGGGQIFWYKDGGVDNSSVLGYSDGSSRYTADDTSAPLNPILEYGDSIALKAVMSDGAKSAAMNTSSLIIRGNEAPRGGGIGTNGGIILGDEQKYDYTLKVKKQWTDLPEESLKVPVTVFLKVGDIQLDSVELNEENQWEASFEGLPDSDSLKGNISYAVVESPVPEHFEPIYAPAEIDKDTRVISILVDNQYRTPKDTGSLTVSKTITGNASDSADEFHFKVSLSDTSVNGTYGEMLFTDGVATFVLKGGESKTAVDLPAGITYEVTETDANQNGYTTTSSGASGTILKDITAEAAFTNTKDKGGTDGGGPGKKYGALTVSKTVTGNAGDTTKAFSFTVKLDSSLSGTYGDMTFENGVAEFTLKHGESKTATKLPAGTHYTVTESDNDGYSVTAEGDTGNITKNKTAVAAFTNYKDEEPDTPPDVPTNPDNPNVPTDPNQPEVPTIPDQPTTNITVNQPNQPDTPEHYDNTPKTGDTVNLALWFTVLGISLVGILYCIFRRVLRR